MDIVGIAVRSINILVPATVLRLQRCIELVFVYPSPLIPRRVANIAAEAAERSLVDQHDCSPDDVEAM